MESMHLNSREQILVNAGHSFGALSACCETSEHLLRDGSIV
jgi:hypothetical protein